MYNESMNSQEVKLVDNYLGLLEFLPISVQCQVVQNFFEKHKEELEDFVLYIKCKEANENIELVGEEELFKVLKERV